MNWNELSDEAKSVIEWVENPYTNNRMIIEIKIGEYFQPEEDTYKRRVPTKILITSKIYQEIIKYVTSDKELQGTLTTDNYIFKIKGKLI